MFDRLYKTKTKLLGLITLSPSKLQGLYLLRYFLNHVRFYIDNHVLFYFFFSFSLKLRVASINKHKRTFIFILFCIFNRKYFSTEPVIFIIHSALCLQLWLKRASIEPCRKISHERVLFRGAHACLSYLNTIAFACDESTECGRKYYYIYM